MSLLSVRSRKHKLPVGATKTLELASGEAVTIEAAASDGDSLPTFEMIAYTGGKMQAGWSSPVVVSIDGMKVQNTKVPIRLQHRLDQGVGHTEAVSKTGGMITANGVISRDTESAREVTAASKNGFPWQASIGISVENAEFVKEGESLKANGQEFEGPLYHVTNSSLNEISFVEHGADRKTAAQIAAEHSEGDKMAETKELTLDDRERRIGLVEIGQRYGRSESEVDAAFESGQDSKDFEIASLKLQGMRDGRSRVPNARRDQGVDQDETHKAALLCAMGRSDLLEEYIAADAATEGEALYGRTRSMLGVNAEILKADGVDVTRGRESVLQASQSNSSLGGLYGSVFNVIAHDSFTTSPETVRRFAKPVSHTDFQLNTHAKLHAALPYKKLAQGGELQHGSLDYESTGLSVTTSGIMISVDRTLLINDRAHFLDGLLRELGREAAREEGDDMFVLLNEDESESDFWTADENELSGSSSALSFDGYEAAVTALRSRTDKLGRKLNLAPKFLVVGIDNEATARRIINSVETGRTDGEGVANPWKGSAEVLVDARIPAKQWFLFSDVSNAAAIIATLDGRVGPTVEEVPSPPNILGKTWRGYHDFGVGLHETRAVIRCLGE